MAKQAFTSGVGANGVLQSVCDNDGNIIYQELLGASTAPGGDAGVQDAAPVGALYTNSATGAKFTKVTDTNSTSDWIELAASSVVSTTGTAITAATVADCVDVDAVNCVQWEVTITDTANPTNKRCVTVKGIHDGTDTTDATLADFACDDIVKTGVPFNADLNVILQGTGTSQQMCLEIASTLVGGVDYTVQRVTAS